MSDFGSRVIGTLPCSVINRTLGISLPEGGVWLGSRIHEKIATKHSNDYDICWRYAELCLNNPTYIGIHPKHPGKILLFRRVQHEKKIIMISVFGQPNTHGNYNVASMYCVSEEKVERYRSNETLQTPIRLRTIAADNLSASCLPN